MARSAARKASARKKAAARPRLTVVTATQGGASLGQVESFAEGLSDAYLHCRELGHLWRPKGAKPYRDEDGGGWIRTLRCYRCTTKRVQEISSSGMVLSNKYIHPEGYLMEGLGRIVGEGRGVLRLQAIKRITKE